MKEIITCKIVDTHDKEGNIYQLQFTEAILMELKGRTFQILGITKQEDGYSFELEVEEIDA